MNSKTIQVLNTVGKIFRKINFEVTSTGYVAIKGLFD